jgi:ketosteroid isomerase-like protein
MSLNPPRSLARPALAALALVALAAPALRAKAPQAEIPVVTDALKEMVRTERDFAFKSVKEGMKPAFLEYMAPDGVIFQPLAVNARASWEQRENPGVTLVWEPAFAEMSAAGDLGWTSGPWELRSPEGSTNPTIYGTFVSVWRRQPDGSWRVAADKGVVHTAPEKGGVGSRDIEAAPARDKKWKGTKADVLPKLDAKWASMARSESVQRSWGDVAAQDVRLVGDGNFPLVGLSAAEEYLVNLNGDYRAKTAGQGIAASGDLGYSYGVFLRFEPGGKAATDSTSYLNIWRRQDDGGWRLAVSVLSRVRRE